MNEHYVKYLEKKYAPLYSGRYGGFCIGDGWFNLINNLSYELCRKWLDTKHELEFAQANLGKEDMWGRMIDDARIRELMSKVETERKSIPRAAQIKEKFGGLRFYVEGASKEQHAVIWYTESISNYVCEQCGARGKHRPSGWVKTLCNKHWKEHQEDMKKRHEALDELSALSQELGGY